MRPDSADLPLFLHILGGFATVGALILAATFLVPAWRQGSLASLRLGYRTLLLAAVPSFLVMRISAQWLYDEEGWGDIPEEPAWIGIGWITSDMGALLLVIATAVTGVGVRRAGAGGEGKARGGRVAAILIGVLLAVYVLAIWAMTTKPA